VFSWRLRGAFSLIWHPLLCGVFAASGTLRTGATHWAFSFFLPFLTFLFHLLSILLHAERWDKWVRMYPMSLLEVYFFQPRDLDWYDMIVPPFLPKACVFTTSSFSSIACI
jgi:hypothetical protein